jgi:hypothetical protein
MTYFEALLQAPGSEIRIQRRLSAPPVSKVITSARGVTAAVARVFLVNNELAPDYFEAVDKITSSTKKARSGRWRGTS